MGAVGATGAGADVAASCGLFEAWTVVADPLSFVSVAPCESRERWTRAIGLEDVVIRMGDETRPAAAAALESVPRRHETSHNEDSCYQNDEAFRNMS
jgi:hypothetical protein